MQFDVESLFNTLKNRAPGVQALVLLRPDGRLLGHAAVDPQLNTDSIASEYATFLRIARRTAEDTGMGDPEEHILVSAPGLVIMRRLPDNHVAVLVCSKEGQVGRLRYELKRSLLYSTFFHYELERT